MPLNPLELDALTLQLSNPSSAKRRSAAKKLRKMASRDAGPALLVALQKELGDERTWETQYQMIMALAECNYREAIGFLRELSNRPFTRTMVLAAIGDSLVRLGRQSEHDETPLLAILRDTRRNWCLADGALRATAMLRLRFSLEVTDQILHLVRSWEIEELQFWTAVACAGWSGRAVDDFLEACLHSNREEFRRAAALARVGEYGVWHPL